MRHFQQEYQINKNVLPLATRSLIFQLVELSLHRVITSRAFVRFTQHTKINNFNLTQFIEQTLFKPISQHLSAICQENVATFCPY